MSETAVLVERLNTHIDDSTQRHKNHEERISPLEDFMKEIKNDIKWVQRILIGLVGLVASPYAVEIFKYFLKN